MFSLGLSSIHHLKLRIIFCCLFMLELNNKCLFMKTLLVLQILNIKFKNVGTIEPSGPQGLAGLALISRQN